LPASHLLGPEFNHSTAKKRKGKKKEGKNEKLLFNG
jgi:hypothetical protein